MRNISFAHTTQRIRDRTKTVTRRVGWRFLKSGDLLSAVVKSQRLRKGEKVQRLATIRVVDVRQERLIKMWHEREYGLEECRREGFGDDPRLSNPTEFAEWFASSHGCDLEDTVTRIESSST